MDFGGRVSYKCLKVYLVYIDKYLVYRLCIFIVWGEGFLMVRNNNIRDILIYDLFKIDKGEKSIFYLYRLFYMREKC